MYDKSPDTKKIIKEDKSKHEKQDPHSPWRYSEFERVALERIVETNRLYVPNNKKNRDLRDRL